jgi:hypothetical protein
MSILGRLIKWGGESHLMALITNWQKGFRSDPFRHCHKGFMSFPKIEKLEKLDFLLGILHGVGFNDQNFSIHSFVTSRT